MDEVQTTIRVRPGFKTHISKHILEAIDAKEEDYIIIKVSLANSN